jgi:LPXTG-motif cell wall-anchored protein
MLKIVSIGILSIVLSSGCLATKLLIPDGEPLTVEESAQVNEIRETVKDVVETVGFVAKHTNDVLVPGGVGTLILGGLGIWYRKRKRKNG